MDNIARNGHVYMFKTSGDMKPRLKSVGKNRATVFTGYCNYHDTKLFSSIDFRKNLEFNQDNTEQAVRLSLRAVSHEYWSKLNTKNFYTKVVSCAKRKDIDGLKILLNVDENYAQSFIDNVDYVHSLLLQGTKVASTRIGRMFRSLLTQIENNRFHLSEIKRYNIPDVCSLAASTLISPEFDFENNRIALLLPHADTTYIALNILPMRNSTWFVFLYHKRFRSKVAPLFNQLDQMSFNQLGIIMSKLILMHSENVVFSPDLVENLPDDSISIIEEIYGNNIFTECPYSDLPDVNLFK